MTKYIDAMQARKSFGSLLDKTFYQNQFTVIKRANRPMAALVPYEFLQALESYNKELTEKILNSAKRNKLSYGKAFELANEATRFARKQ